MHCSTGRSNRVEEGVQKDEFSFRSASDQVFVSLIHFTGVLDSVEELIRQFMRAAHPCAAPMAQLECLPSRIGGSRRQIAGMN
jgi:hypothetical protein